MNVRTRQGKIERLKKHSKKSVVIIGGGINGIGLFRELSLQGVDVLLVEQSDYCSAASSAPSRMIHGGLRYMENGEFALVKESLHERNLLLNNARHYVFPLPTTIPIFSWVDGVLATTLKFFGLNEKPSKRGALIIKLGLSFYDFFTRGRTTMPKHRFHSKKETFKKWSFFNKNAVCSATYYDAWISFPERLGMELVTDAEEASDSAIALNYARLLRSDGQKLVIKDTLTEEEICIEPDLVVNATGAWIDNTNRNFDKSTDFIGGTKGSHLIVRNDDLYRATGDGMVYFENAEGRVCILFPYMGNVLVGSTDLPVSSPDGVHCTPEEEHYILESLKYIFPAIEITPEQVLYRFSGVRPLPSSNTSTTGQISRNHSCQVLPADHDRTFPIFSLVGGKWTTFRAFGEQVADRTLSELGLSRTTSTENIAIGGGKGFPETVFERKQWLKKISEQCRCSEQRAEALLARYGTHALHLADYLADKSNQPLDSHQDYSTGEIRFLIEKEQVECLTDLILRRTSLAISGDLNLDIIRELNGQMADIKQWNHEQQEVEFGNALSYLEQYHGVDYKTLSERSLKFSSCVTDKVSTPDLVETFVH